MGSGLFLMVNGENSYFMKQLDRSLVWHSHQSVYHSVLMTAQCVWCWPGIEPALGRHCFSMDPGMTHLCVSGEKREQYQILVFLSGDTGPMLVQCWASVANGGQHHTSVFTPFFNIYFFQNSHLYYPYFDRSLFLINVLNILSRYYSIQ